MPSPFADAAVVLAHFAEQPDAVRASGVLLFGSSVPLAIYAATVSTRLRQLGVTAPGTTIALAGGVLAAGALAASGLLWTLSQPGVRGGVAAVRALHDLVFVTAGVAHVVFLGLLVAGGVVPGLVLRLLPRPLAVAGLVVAGLAELSFLSLAVPALAVLLPLARFPGLVWLIAAGFLLPHQRPRRSSAATA